MYNLTQNNNFLKGYIWASKGFRYYINGKSLSISLENIFNNSLKLPKITLFNANNEKYQAFYAEINRFVKENIQHLKQIQYTATNIISDAAHSLQSSLPIVSFSGGKDSTVVSHLVCSALSNPSIIHVFGNTSLEFDWTENYINRFRKNNSRTPLLESKSEHDFMELCHEIGPPSRVMSWCCTVFKTGPLNNLLKGLAKDKGILTFYGIRKTESISRSNYQEFKDKDFLGLHKSTNIVTSPKIHSQKVVSPIFEWHDIDVWLYLFYHSLDFNDSYRLGYSRVGCWCCPNNSSRSSFLTSIFMPEKYKEWNDFLVAFAQKIGKKDPESYVKSGKWKARQGGAGLNSRQINIEAKPCVDEEHSRTITLTKPIDEELYEYMKPFGIISKEMGRKLLNEVYILDCNTYKPVLTLQGKIGSYNIKITAINPVNYRLLSQRIDCQLRKYQSCIGCLGCVSVCPQGAIIYNHKQYTISQEKCISCWKCINPWGRGGCLMSKVLAVKKGG